MTGLDLELFLKLLRADLGAWAALGLAVVVLALLVWTSWGSRRALRKCLVLSIFAHLGLALYGSTLPFVGALGSIGGGEENDKKEHLQSIQVTSTPTDKTKKTASASGLENRNAPWDQPQTPLALAEARIKPLDHPSPANDAAAPGRTAADPKPLAPPDASPTVSDPTQTPTIESPLKPSDPQLAAKPEADPDVNRTVDRTPSTISSSDEVAAIPNRRLRSETMRGQTGAIRSDAPRRQVRGSDSPLATNRQPEPTPAEAGNPQRSGSSGGENQIREGATDATALASEAMPTDPQTVGSASATSTPSGASASDPLPSFAEATIRGRASSSLRSTSLADQPKRVRSTGGAVPIARATPKGVSPLPDVPGVMGGRPLADIPEVYRSRLDPNRSTLARKSGASNASELAVERALDWLARHQDADGRWNGGAQRGNDGQILPGQFDFTNHCPPAEICAGPCFYAEADSAMTGLALLAFLGAGYTHVDGKYATVVGDGVDYLLLIQKPDGSLRGDSRSIGMYCHAMAALALCEAYALSGDERLKDPVKRAVQFVIKGKSSTGVGWRYLPNGPDADTSVLGWVVMLLKSASEVGIDVPEATRQSALKWLEKVAEGDHAGLAIYAPGNKITPTMTAEAWVCRQFLGVGGPGAASREASEYLLRNAPDRGDANFYYWYYGTLAMYQNGGPEWARWNSVLRDRLIERQIKKGHSSGSWDRDEDGTWGIRGGRIYTTAMATLTLEVYYRYLRLYEPAPSPRVAPKPRASEPGLRR